MTDVISIPQAAQLAGVSVRTMRKHYERGRVRGNITEGRIYLMGSDVREYIRLRKEAQAQGLKKVAPMKGYPAPEPVAQYVQEPAPRHVQELADATFAPQSELRRKLKSRLSQAKHVRVSSEERLKALQKEVEDLQIEEMELEEALTQLDRIEQLVESMT